MNNMNEKEMFDLDDITTTEDILTYFSQYMPSGNYETEGLYEKLQKKSLTHQEFNELCENVMDFLSCDNWLYLYDILGDHSVLEQAIVMTAEQAPPLMPLSMYEYDAINKMDMWQEQWGLDDIGELDNAVTEVFADPEARRLIGEYALKGEYLELAENIGVAAELGIEIYDEEE